jgi:methyl-accepting chemotaxis protein
MSDLFSLPYGGSRAATGGGGAMPGYFSHHGVWAPGIRMFRNLGFKAKAWIISACFALPIALLALSYFTFKAETIGFSSKELVGIEYGRAVLPVLNLSQRERLSATMASAGQNVPAPDPAALDKAWSDLLAAQRAHGQALGTEKAFAAMQAAGQALPAAGAGRDAVFAAHTARVQAVLDLLAASTDGSNLTLDPDIDTYYLMDAAFFRLPPILEGLAQLRGLGATVLADGQVTPAQRRLLIEKIHEVRLHLVAMEQGLAKAIAYNSHVAGATEAEPDIARLHSFLAQAEARLLADTLPAGQAGEHIEASQQTMGALMALADRCMNELETLITLRVSAFVVARNLTALLLVSSLVLVVYLFASFGRVLHGGLQEVAHHIQAMSEGDLTTHPQPWGRDEAADLMLNLQQMQASLRRIVDGVRGASDNIMQSSAEIASASMDLSARTEQAAANLQQSASAMEQITVTVDRTAEAAAQAADIARANADAAESGGKIVASMVTVMSDIHGSSGRIADITGTIDGIAFQTNILALNAAVEAARAGDSGRGFAVVAAEVRQLARRSSEAAREIRELIDASVGRIEAGAQVAQRAGSTMDQLLQQAHQVDKLLAEIATGASEQAAGVNQTTLAVQEMDRSTQQNAALVEQTAASAAGLKGQAEALATQVGQFQM